MKNDEHSGKGLFPNANKMGRKPIYSGPIGPAPDGAVSVQDLRNDYSPLIDKINDLFVRLKAEVRKHPSKLVSVPFEGIEVHGGNYEYVFGGHATTTVCIEPTNFRDVVKPRLEQLVEEKKLTSRRGQHGKSRVPKGFVGVSKDVPYSYGASKLKLAVKSALEEAMRSGAPTLANGGYAITVDDVPCTGRLFGKACLVLETDMPALAVLGARYDKEHHEYRYATDTGCSTKDGSARWQALIDRSPSGERTRG